MPSSSHIFSSVTDLAGVLNEQIRQTVRSTGSVVVQMSDLALLMKTCKGRDKVCALVQYLCEVYSRAVLAKALRASRLKVALKNGRKIFKLLKFMEGAKKVSKMVRDGHKPWGYRLVYLGSVLIGMATNFLDNVLWLTWVGFITTNRKPIKLGKDVLSVAKSLIWLVFLVLTFARRRAKISHCLEGLAGVKAALRRTSYHYPQARRLLKQRRKIRFNLLDSAILLLRLAMLGKRLRALAYSDLLYGLLGLSSTSLAVFRLLFQKPKWLEVEERREEQYNFMARSALQSELFI